MLRLELPCDPPKICCHAMPIKSTVTLIIAVSGNRLKILWQLTAGYSVTPARSDVHERI
jgi:hypothetical protein